MNGTYRAIRFSTLTNPANSDLCLMKQRSSTVFAEITHFWPNLTCYKTWSTSSFASASTSTPFVPVWKACFCKLALIHKTKRHFVFRGGRTQLKKSVYQYVRQISGSKESPTCAIKRNATDNETTFPEAGLLAWKTIFSWTTTSSRVPPKKKPHGRRKISWKW